jgi:hypothetical protein
LSDRRKGGLREMTVGKWTAGAIERFEDWTASVELVDYHQDEESAGIYFIDRRPPLQQLVSGSQPDVSQLVSTNPNEMQELSQVAVLVG